MRHIFNAIIFASFAIISVLSQSPHDTKPKATLHIAEATNEAAKLLKAANTTTRETLLNSMLQTVYGRNPEIIEKITIIKKGATKGTQIAKKGAPNGIKNGKKGATKGTIHVKKGATKGNENLQTVTTTVQIKKAQMQNIVEQTEENMADPEPDDTYVREYRSVDAVFEDENNRFAEEIKEMRRPTNPLEAVIYWLQIINIASMCASSTLGSLPYPWEGPQGSAVAGVYRKDLNDYRKELTKNVTPRDAREAAQTWGDNIRLGVSYFKSTLEVIHNAGQSGPELDQKENGKARQKRRKTKLPQKYSSSGRTLITPGLDDAINVLKRIPVEYRPNVNRDMREQYNKGTLEKIPPPDACGP